MEYFWYSESREQVKQTNKQTNKEMKKVFNEIAKKNPKIKT